MSDELRVYVVDRGRSRLYMRCVDPLTGRVREKSTGKMDPEEAQKEAEKWETELRGPLQSPVKHDLGGIPPAV